MTDKEFERKQKEDTNWIFDGKEIIPKKRVDDNFIDSDCCESDEELSFEIEFPTGELMFYNGLGYEQYALEALNNHPHSIGSIAGNQERIINYSTKNFLHIYVGDSLPSLWIKDNKLAIGTEYYSEECDCEFSPCNCKPTEILPIEDSVEIICIYHESLWTSLIDVEVYKNLLIENFGEEKLNKLPKIELYELIAKVKPGRYRCTYYRKALEREEFTDEILGIKEPIIYCKLELIE